MLMQIREQCFISRTATRTAVSLRQVDPQMQKLRRQLIKLAHLPGVSESQLTAAIEALSAAGTTETGSVLPADVLSR
jgi:hypothetical protein